MTAHRVSVILPARNAAHTLGAAVASVMQQSHVDEIVIAVGPSADDTERLARSLAESHSTVWVVDNPSGTTPAGLNLALSRATGDVIVRCDAHAVLPADYVATAIELLDRTGAGNVGGRQVPNADSGFAVAVAAAMRSPAGSGGAAYRSGTRARPVETVYLGVFRREALEAVGGYDERLLRNQDYELNHRLRMAGWQVWFDPRLEVAYRPRGAVGALAGQYLDYGRYKRLVMLEHPRSVRLRQLAPLALVALVVASIAVGWWTRSWWLPAGTVGSYVGGLLIAGCAADRRRGFGVAVALAVMHWSWALGFLQGPRASERRRRSATQ